MEYNPLDTLEDSMCVNCVHRITRLIEPMTEDFIEYVLDKMGVDEFEDDAELLIEQHRCIITGEDIDGIVHSCNKYAPLASTFLIRENIF